MSGAPDHIKRFYKTVSVANTDNGFSVLLDGRQARTMMRLPLAAPTQSLADAIAKEWQAQGEHIDNQSMPLTGLLSASINGGEQAASEWAGEILNYLQSDLVCYRAERPEKLVALQAQVWDPYIDWINTEFGASLVTATGIVAVNQPDAAAQTIKLALQDQSPSTLFAVKMATSMTGSAVLALALWKRAYEPVDIFQASRVDEHFQEQQWGTDAEAKAREGQIRSEFLTVAKYLSLL